MIVLEGRAKEEGGLWWEVPEQRCGWARVVREGCEMQRLSGPTQNVMTGTWSPGTWAGVAVGLRHLAAWISGESPWASVWEESIGGGCSCDQGRGRNTPAKPTELLWRSFSRMWNSSGWRGHWIFILASVAAHSNQGWDLLVWSEKNEVAIHVNGYHTKIQNGVFVLLGQNITGKEWGRGRKKIRIIGIRRLCGVSEAQLKG